LTPHIDYLTGQSILLLMRLRLSLTLLIPLRFGSQNQKDGNTEDGENSRSWPMPAASHQSRHSRRFYRQIDAYSQPRNHGVAAGLLAGALVGITMGGIPSSLRVCGGQRSALHDGKVTRTS
jgi:hypothetical protein